MTYEAVFEQAERESKAKNAERSITLFEQAVSLTQEPIKKARALGEISVLALSCLLYTSRAKSYGPPPMKGCR